MVEEEFKNWMCKQINRNDKKYTQGTIDGYCYALKKACEEMRNLNISTYNLFEIDCLNEFSGIQQRIRMNSDFLRVNKKYGNGCLSAGMLKYSDFLLERLEEGDKSNIKVEHFEFESDRQFIIADFTRKLLKENYLILEHSNNTHIRFSHEKLDNIVDFIGKGWSKQITRMLLFEIENRKETYRIKLIIGPGDFEVRQKLYSIAKEKTDIYNVVKNEFTNEVITIFSRNLLNEKQIKSLTTNQIKEIIEKGITYFIENDLNKLCENLYSISNVKVKKEILSIIAEVSNLNEVTETEKSIVIKSRIGHGELKKEILKEQGCCKICGLADRRFLIASHIKPWSKSNDQERLDLNNVLLLCPHHDSVFDKGYITFDREGQILISSELTLETRALLNLNPENKIELTCKQSEYIQWHRENVFHV